MRKIYPTQSPLGCSIAADPKQEARSNRKGQRKKQEYNLLLRIHSFHHQASTEYNLLGPLVGAIDTKQEMA